jgi:hypothetical protein
MPGQRWERPAAYSGRHNTLGAISWSHSERNASQSEGVTSWGRGSSVLMLYLTMPNALHDDPSLDQPRNFLWRQP